jgi:hypothetical protein
VTPALDDLIGLCRHDEVVGMQAADLVSPPGDGHPAPLSDDGRVVVFLFGYDAYLVGKLEGSDEIFECKSFL